MLTRLLPVLLAFLLGLLAGYMFFRRGASNPEVDATVLLERIQTVAKLTTVEGRFSEIYDYNDYKGYWTWLYEKKMLVRVQGTVSVGYDLNNLQVTTDPLTRTITIGPLPPPQILSIDHELDYYDIREGFFAEFTPAEYNRINDDAKSLLRRKAEGSALFGAAQAQASDMLEMMRFVVEGAGWRLVVREGVGVLPG